MSKFYFVGDLHLNDVNPRSRIDDYPHAILNKLADLFTQANDNNIKAIFFLGDIFHKPSGLSTKYLNNVIEVFQSSPCPCYSIIGNHDIPFNRVEDVNNTSLGVLFKSKALLPLDIYNVSSDICIYGYNYGTDISFISKPLSCKLGICLSHSYGEDVSFGNSDKPEYFKWSIKNENPFDIYVLGHDHSYHDAMKIYNNSYLFRVGALTRVTSANSDTKREIRILEIDIDEENYSYKTNLIPIQNKPITECFSAQSLDKPFKKDVDISSSLEDVLANLNFSIQSNIFDIIDSMDLDSEIVKTLELYLKNNFIERNKE